MIQLGNVLILLTLIMALFLAVIAIIYGYKCIKMSKSFNTYDKKIKTTIMSLSSMIIVLLTIILVLKFQYNKPTNELNGEIEEITDDFSVTKVNVPDESSKVDKNQNGIADPIDIVNSARKEVEKKTIYKDAYYVGGYPPDGEGVCTDVIWRGFKGINISIKDLIDKDIKENMTQYKGVNGKSDPNIDFRRVLNQDVFFKKNCIQLTTEFKEGEVDNLKEWQPGDIVVFIEGYEHIAIISDKRDEKGIPYVIHNAHPCASEAKLSWFHNPIYGHYRWKY